MVKAQSLGDYRARIDKIDERVHALLRERADIALAIADLKRASAGLAQAGGEVPVRPAREAEILRTLAARHQGPLSLASLVRIWREILGASTKLQADLPIALGLSEDDGTGLTLAHELYGAAMAIHKFSNAGAALKALAQGRARLGLVAPPSAKPDGAWWAKLDPSAFRIIQALPLTSLKPEASPRLVVLAKAPFEASGDDVSFVRITGAFDAAKVRRVLASLGGGAKLHAGLTQGRRLHHLIQLERHVAQDDPWVTGLAQALGVSIETVTILGGYPRPLALT